MKHIIETQRDQTYTTNIDIVKISQHNTCNNSLWFYIGTFSWGLHINYEALTAKRGSKRSNF